MGLWLHGISPRSRKLENIWVQHREDLIPSESLLMSVTEHPSFFWLRLKIDWQKSGIIRFVALLKQGQFVSFDYLRS